MILVDGIPLNQALGGGVNLGTLPTGIVESIEVYRGTSPLQLGVSGIGGVINIKTRRIKGTRTVWGQAQMGSFGTYTGSGFVGHKPGAFDYSLAYEHRQADNDFEYLNDRGTKYNMADDRIEKRRNNKFRGDDVSVRAGYDFMNARVDLVNNFKKTHSGLAGPIGSPTESAAYDTLENLTTLKGELQATEDLLLTLKPYAAYKVEELDDRKGEVGGGSQDTHDTTLTLGTDFTAAYSLGRYQTWTFLVQYIHENYEPDDALSRITVPESNRATLALALEDRIELFDRKVLVVPSIRYDHVKNDLNGVSAGRVITGQAGNKSYDEWSPQLGVKYAPFHFLYFKANVGYYHRFPSFFELFGNNGSYIGNIELDPEKGTNYDVGFGVDFYDTTPFLRQVSFEAAYFHSDVDNLISSEQATGNIATSRQVDEAEISGVEISLKINLWDLVHLSGNVTYQDARNKGPVKGKKDKYLPQRPVWEADFRTGLTLWKFEPYYAYHYIDKNYLNASNIGEVEARSLHDAGVSLKATDWLTLSFEVINFTDEAYQDFFGYPAPGRAYYGTVMVKF